MSKESYFSDSSLSDMIYNLGSQMTQYHHVTRIAVLMKLREPVEDRKKTNLMVVYVDTKKKWL